MISVEIGLGNQYGNVEVNKKDDGTYTLGLEDYDCYSEKQISKELYELIVKELCDADEVDRQGED